MHNTLHLLAHAWFLGLLVICVNGIPASLECRNPLFETHWFNSDGTPQSLGGAPTLRTNLRLCPAYNGLLSCCRQSFEREQQLHFQFWRQILASKLARVRKNKQAAEAVQKLEAFNAASHDDRKQYERALQIYDQVLDPKNHAGCFANLLAYIAGMICFACESRWQEEVQLDLGKVVRIMLTTGTCVEIWSACESFGYQAQVLQQVVLDSRLALMQDTAMENLDMFFDQQLLCDWMHDSIAMHPFTTPTEAEREATPPVAHIERRLSRVLEYDPIKAGRASGFDITWNGVIASSGGSVVLSAPLLKVLIAGSTLMIIQFGLV